MVSPCRAHIRSAHHIDGFALSGSHFINGCGLSALRFARSAHHLDKNIFQIQPGLSDTLAMRSPLPTFFLWAASVIAAGQHPAAAPPPLIKENATQKISDHVYVISDGNVPAVP